MPQWLSRSRYAHNWAAIWLNKRAVKRHIGLFRGQMLDIGCGEKPYEDLLASRVTGYIGVDHVATQHSASRADVWADATELPFGDEQFDTVAAFQVLEHLPEPLRALREAHRVLRREGRIFISTPFMWGVHEAPHDYFRYTPYGLRHLLERAGFVDIKVESVAGYWFTTGLRFSYYLQRFARGPLFFVMWPVLTVVQVAAILADRVDRVDSDAAGYVTTARRE
jgi:SAM-dependent methyltransferase